MSECRTMLEQRLHRVRETTKLKPPDRVPLIPSLGNYYVYSKGISMQQAMTDPTCLEASVRAYMAEVTPDMLNAIGLFPISAMETSGFTAGRWPGPYYGLPENTPYQYLDTQYLEDEDYDLFLADPSRFILKKLLPQKHTAFAGLAEIEPYMLCDSAIFPMSVFARPEVRSSLEALIRTGEQTAAFQKKLDALNRLGPECGFPVYGEVAAMAPFDSFADHIRGLLPACMDCVMNPERLDLALQRWGDVMIPLQTRRAQEAGAEYVFMPLHCGVDEFMSPANYERFYWSGLKRAILSLLDAGMTPIIFCEGRYQTRLHTLTDVPRGKVIYLFENVDFDAAKRILGDTACIAGGMPSSLLSFGDRQQIIDETKRLIDTCAPGGGYIMSNSISLDHVPPENMEAWRDTVFTYGCYGSASQTG